MPLTWLNIVAAALLTTQQLVADAAPLRLHLADNHAESFRWFAETLDLDERYRMVLIDHHSDASCVERSDDVREQLRRVASLEERSQRCRQWRDNGRIQAYNWIEPLMPRPIQEVTWIPALTTNEEKKAKYLQEAHDSLDARLEFELRSAGSLAANWHVSDLSSYQKSKPRRVPTVIALDLDFFLGVPRNEWQQTWDQLWERILREPLLVSVSCSLSRPWFHSQEEADELLRMTFWTYARTFPATVTLDLEIDNTPDQSLQASALREKGKKIPRWDAEQLPDDLKCLLAMHGKQWIMRDRQRSWPKILENWEKELPPPTWLSSAVDADGIIRITRNDPSILRLDPPPDYTGGNIRWWMVEPMHHAVDLLSETSLGKNFSLQPASFLSDTRRLLAETPDLALDLTKHCSQPGRYRIFAEIPLSDGSRRQSTIADIRVREGDGFHAALSEMMRQPYVFGIALTKNGCENGWGSDCSNILVAAWRRCGVPMKWGDPNQVTTQLQEHQPHTPLSEQTFAEGVAISFGTHMAAIWRDHPPVGLIGDEDDVIHHLGAAPEIINLGKLAKEKGTYRIYHLPEEKFVEIGFIGDVVMKNSKQEDLQKLQSAMSGLDATFGNLEGLPADADGEMPLDFRFGSQSLKPLQQLYQHGLTALSIANNHAGDGEKPTSEARSRLQDAKLSTLGHLPVPYHWQKNGVQLSLFGICAVPTTGQVTQWPQDRDALRQAISAERNMGRHCIVLVHWGQEYQSHPDSSQKSIAQQLLSMGCIAIIGAHPHVDQPISWHRGGMVAYSLGNAIYPEPWRKNDSGSLLSLRISTSGRVKMLKREQF